MTAPQPVFDTSGYVRRARRLADLSQRELATQIGVDQSAISRVEGGRDLEVNTFLRILATANLRVAIVDASGEEVTAMPGDVVRDRAGRRKPAHLDVHARPETRARGDRVRA
jgi:HTH-type transcriptional regulator/antitoxin HipB